MYNFKPTPELVWAMVVTVTGVVATAVTTQGEVGPTDWQAWAIGLATGVLRAVVGLILDKAKPDAA